jgi:carbon starvation protein CstA
MSDIILLISVALVFGAIISDWKTGIPIGLYTGFIQDPLRKIIPEQPVALNLLIVGILILTALSAIVKFRRFSLSEVFQNYSNLQIRKNP